MHRYNRNKLYIYLCNKFKIKFIDIITISRLLFPVSCLYSPFSILKMKGSGCLYYYLRWLSSYTPLRSLNCNYYYYISSSPADVYTQCPSINYRVFPSSYSWYEGKNIRFISMISLVIVPIPWNLRERLSSTKYSLWKVLNTTPRDVK